MFGQQDPGYEFSARPKVVDNRPKFRDPYGQTYEYIPQNIMHDKRIARGSTHASMVIPAGNHPDALFLEKKKEQQRRAKMQQEEEARRQAEEYAQRDIKTPEPLPGRVNLGVETDPFVENLTDKPTEFEIGVQSDFYIDRPPTPLFVPQKIGEDAETQVEKDDPVYEFNDIVEPVLTVLCHNTIEQAQMEVYEENEFSKKQNHKREFEKIRNLKLIEAQRLEAAETRRKQEIERRRNQVRARMINRINAHQKYTSRQIAKKFLANVCPTTLQLLKDQGTLVEPLGVLLHEQIVPWLLDNTLKFLKEDDMIDENTEELVVESLNHPAKAHHETVEAENKRLLELEREKKEKQMAKEERHRKRAEAAEAARKAEELRQLKEQIKEEFIDSADTKERILIHEVADTDGNLQNTPIIGMVGGHFTHLLIVISTIAKHYKEKAEDLLEIEAMTRFLVTYLSQNMKQDHMLIKMSRDVENYIKEKEIKMTAMGKTKEDKKKPFKEMLTDPESGMLNETLRYLIANAEEYDLDVETIKLVNQALIDIITKSPVKKEGNLAKLDPTIEKIKLTPVPEEVNPDELKFKAIARIRIPMEEEKDEEEEQEPVKKSRGKNRSKDLDKSKELDKSKDLDKSLNKSKDTIKSKASAEPSKDGEGAKEGEGDNEDAKKEVKLKEAEIEDRVVLINPNSEDQNIHIIHQAAARILRKDIFESLVKFSKDLEEVDADEAARHSEGIANKLEEKFIYQNQHLPVFDYEIN